MHERFTRQTRWPKTYLFSTQHHKSLSFETRRRCHRYMGPSSGHRGSLLDRRNNECVSQNTQTFRLTTKRVRGSLINEFEDDLIDMVNSRNGTPLLCDAIAQKQPECVLKLLELAQRHKRFVLLRTGRCRTLDWAISSGAKVVAKFVLDVVAEEKLPVEESSCILTNYLFPLIRAFPDLMKDYIRNDSFAFEYGRFSICRSLIDKNGKRPIAMTSDELPERFKGLTAETARDFWVEHCKEHSEDLKESTDFQVEMSAKFFCIDLDAARVRSYDDTVGIRSNPKTHYYFWDHVLWQMQAAKLPLEIFKSETLTTFANWMFSSLRKRFLLLGFLDVLTALLFSLFAWSYAMKRCPRSATAGNDDKMQTTGASDLRQLTSLVAIILSCAVPLFSLSIRFSRIKCVCRSVCDSDHDRRMLHPGL